MSRESYFKKFPIISYNGTPSINILRRTSFNSEVKNFVSAFYPITLEENVRIDHLAFDYYDTVDYDWLIYHMNGIIDPYYDVLLSNEELEKLIKKKYGSLRNAMRKTSHYENNYRGDDSLYSVSQYNTLTTQQKKYWTPLKNAISVVGYERSKEDFTVSTNFIETITFSDEGNPFETGEIIKDTIDPDTFAEVLYADSNSCTYQHVRGEFLSGRTIIGESSEITRVINDKKLLHSVIPTEEQVYYSPVSFYDVEVRKNDQNREIYLVDKLYSEKLNTQLENLLK